MTIEAVDLFAGTGWGVALQRLGIEEHGVEIMPEAQASREANGMRTWLDDVWTVLETAPLDSSEFAAALLIASPPCQTFSAAGHGKGRKALDEVLALIDARAYQDVTALREFGERHDPRTALVLTPLAYVYRHLPTYIALEQVPPVLPVWERYAVELRAWGYSVAVGIVHAEEHGVPQTRKRAILVARADGGKARLPAPTHNRYNPRAGVASRTADPSLLPWVSMAEALGWGMTERPFVTAGNAVGRAEGVGGTGGKEAIEREKSRGAWTHVERHRGAGMLERGGDRPARPVDHPAPTLTGNASGTTPGGFRKIAQDDAEAGPWRVGFARKADDKGEATPDGYRARDLRTDDLPAQHVTEKARSWTRSRPATTITGDSRVWPPGHKVNAADIARLGEDEAREKYGDRAGTKAERITLAEAAALQSYPAGFRFCGTQTKQFLQIGNAVPPLMAEAILRGLLA